MSKGRFDNLDVQAMVANLQSTLCGRRISNIYDGITNDSFILKLDGSGDRFLLLESGVRFHTISNFSAESTMPSPTASKLRKHLKNLRIEKVSQIGQDRVVLFHCGVGPNRHALILELYAKGNLILTDANYTVLALLRSHIFDSSTTDATAVAVQVGHVYPVSYATNLGADQDVDEAAVIKSPSEWNEWTVQLLQTLEADAASGNKKKKNKQMTLKMLMSRHDSVYAHLGPALIEHCILNAQLQPHSNLKEQIVVDEKTGTAQVLTVEDWSRLLESFQTEASRILATMEKQQRGYILYKQREELPQSLDNGNSLAHADKVFEEFIPIRLMQHEHRPTLEFEDFSRAVAEYFDRFQMQRNLQKALNAEKAAADKITKARLDQQERLDSLYRQQELLRQEASTVQMHAEDVDKALAVINSALDSGMDWQQLEQVVDVEQQNQNPIALLIHKLVLEEEAMILRLPTSIGIEVENSDVETLDIKILLKETAHGNANRLFTQYSNAKEKASKTIDASAKALKAAEESAKRQLAAAQKKSKQQVVSTSTKHKPAWFEKFRWFITTDNYLVIGGRDAHQNEQLVKRYLRPGDAYLHADVFGAASCILRAKRQRRKGEEGTEIVPLSEQALREAGHFTICQSSAWTSRMVTSAWWVESHQVSKTPPAGEFLTVGAFMIRGKKNYLPPSQLEMGLGVMFRLGDEASIHRHLGDRRDFALMNQEETLDESPTQNLKTRKPVQETFNEINDMSNKLETLGCSGKEGDAMIEVDDQEPHTLEALNETEEVCPGEILDTPTSEVDAHDSNKESQKEKERRGLSVRDRKLIKKYGSIEAARTALEKLNETQKNTKKEKKVDQVSTDKTTRGKKTKQKRAQKKYADQDEEDKELAMRALQGGEKAKKKKTRGKHGSESSPEYNEKQNEVAAETNALLTKDPLEVARRLPDAVRNELALCVTTKDGNGVVSGVKWDKFDAETLEQLFDLENLDAQLAAARRLRELKETKQVDNFSASLGGVIRTIRKYGHDAKQSIKGNQDRHESDTTDQNLTEMETDVVDDTAELNRLTSKPGVEDLLVAAVPICAPYHTLSQYLFRVKLTPGSMKRGKASKQCLELFTKSKQGGGDETKKLVSLIKQVPESDWVNALLGDVRISAPGAAKIDKKQKAQKKKMKK